MTKPSQAAAKVVTPAEAVLRNHRETLEGIASVARAFAHSLNNLLAVSKGNLALLQFEAGEAGDESRAIVGDVMDALARAQQLSGNLAAVSYWREFRARAVSPKAFFRAREEGFTSLLGPAHALEISVEEGITHVHTDPSYLELAVNALLLNASQAMDGTGQIRIECQAVDVPSPAAGRGKSARPAESTRMLCLAVEDCGRRTAVDAASKLFRAGFSATSATGVGLGLWLVRQFALATGGNVFVEKAERRRNRIGLLLPIR